MWAKEEGARPVPGADELDERDGLDDLDDVPGKLPTVDEAAYMLISRIDRLIS